MCSSSVPSRARTGFDRAGVHKAQHDVLTPERTGSTMKIAVISETLQRERRVARVRDASVKPARSCLDVGVVAGGAGLHAIATARRRGAVVEAYDVRPAVKEEVKSLGASFLEFELEAQEGAGGYAREQSEEFLTKQRELLTERVAAADVVITTAAIPGRRAPLLVTAPMVKGMRRGSVIVNLAAETGGNCEVTQPGQVVEVDGVWVDGTTNIPSTMALSASLLYAHNVTN